jgi:protein gp37
MGAWSAIEWTDATWNPVTGCSKASPGCAHCYAEAFSLRFGYTRKPWTRENATENVLLRPDRLEQPLRWRRPRMVFVNSMSDLFHEHVPFDFVDRVYAVMSDARQHVFQILTKRPERALEFYRLRPGGLDAKGPRNVWFGVSVENSRYTWRADLLRQIPAAVRFVSAEPLLGSLFENGFRHAPLDLRGINWLIAGGESGPRCRPVRIDWVRELRDTCEREGVAFFFKQWGGRTPKAGGRILDNQVHNAMPVAAMA